MRVRRDLRRRRGLAARLAGGGELGELELGDDELVFLHVSADRAQPQALIYPAAGPHHARTSEARCLATHRIARFDVVTVGGGIAGLAAAREILARRPGTSLAVVGKEPAVGGHQSGHN